MRVPHIVNYQLNFFVIIKCSLTDGTLFYIQELADFEKMSDGPKLTVEGILFKYCE